MYCLKGLYDMNFEEKFNLDVENLKSDLAIEDMYVTDEDISMLRKYSTNEISLNEAISNIIKSNLD